MRAEITPRSSSLAEQVRAEITRFALDDGRLRALCEARQLDWDAAAAARMVAVTVAQITSSLEARGEVSYSLASAGSEARRQRRTAAVQRYLEKLVEQRVQMERQAAV